MEGWGGEERRGWGGEDSKHSNKHPRLLAQKQLAVPWFRFASTLLDIGCAVKCNSGHAPPPFPAIAHPTLLAFLCQVRQA